jgi:hypothetical protein
MIPERLKSRDIAKIALCLTANFGLRSHKTIRK